MRKLISLDLAALAVIVGLMPLLFLPVLPSIWFCFSLLLLASFCLLFCRLRNRASYFVVITILSLLWGLGCARHTVNKLEKYAEQTVVVTGQIKTANVGQSDSGTILFSVEWISERQLSWFEQFDVALNWQRDEMVVTAGQTWQLLVQLRPIHSRLNEGGFDSQRWGIANQRLFSARVKQASLIDEQPNLRQRIIEHSVAKIGGLASADLLIGLAFGERSLLDAERRKLLLHTGTAHLMAISGLHISLAAMVGWWLARGSQLFFSTRLIGVKYPQVASWFMALAYVWLSGANPPALRALLALTFWFCLRWKGGSWHSWQVWLRIVALLLLSNPLTILSDSLWLSCCAVAVLIFWFQWAPLPLWLRKKRWAVVQWFHLQSAIILLLMPLQVAIFNGTSWSSLAANLLAVPMVSLITVPGILLALLFDWWPLVSGWFWSLADGSLQIILPLLTKMAVGWWPIGYHWQGFSFIGWIAVISWRLELWRNHLVLLVALVCLCLTPVWRQPDYRWRLDMLDVGHGLAVVIRRGDRALIYDTGNRWLQGSMAEKEILPFLRWHGLTLDGIMISHEDSDHLGGLEILQQYYPQSWLRSSSSSLNSGSCVLGDHWRWQGLDFTVLWPPEKVAKAANKASCVVRIDDGYQRILLTGDLEGAQELELVRTMRAELAADILQVPHHGSKTSSSGPFLRAVDPAISIVSISRYNPWRLPAKMIRDRYYQADIPWHSTGDSGQLTLLFFEQNWQFLGFREQIMPRWYHRWFGDKADHR